MAGFSRFALVRKVDIGVQKGRELHFPSRRGSDLKITGAVKDGRVRGICKKEVERISNRCKKAGLPFGGPPFQTGRSVGSKLLPLFSSFQKSKGDAAHQNK